MLKIYYADIPEIDERGVYPLSDYRKAKLDKLKPAHTRNTSVAAELLLLHALRECAPNVAIPPDIFAGEHGKPYLRNGGVYFNISHSADTVACAICDDEVGLDIQYITEYKPELAARFFAEDECAYVESGADRNAAFTEIWSKKESYIKALGTGLITPLASFSVLHMSGLFYTVLGDYSLSVCVPGHDEPTVDFIKKVDLG